MRVAPFVVLATALIAAEPYRPVFHFSPAKNWTNDPCGMFYKDGKYHLFFQYNPEGDQWGHMSWGHAISEDLITWKEQPVAIPESDGVMIFTGSSVVEKSGRIASIYTGHRPTNPPRQNQNIAFSTDGLKWTKDPANPILDIGNVPDFRDPKVFWYEPSKRWIMVVMLPREFKASFYESLDLKKWEHLSDFGPAGVEGTEWECPDFYQLPVDGDANNTRWILKVGISRKHIAGGSGEQYFVGRFNGRRFVSENPTAQVLWLDHGPDCYCEFSFSNMPQGARPTAIGWMNNWIYAGSIPTSPWRGQMTIPRQFSLKSTPDGLRLFQEPAAELARIRQPHKNFESYEFRALIPMGKAPRAEWTLMDGLKIGYDAVKGELYVDRTHAGDTAFNAKFPGRFTAPVRLRDGKLELDVFVDRMSVEVFAQRGEVVFTTLVFPKKTTPLTYEGPKGQTAIFDLVR